jgi:hypothetical protein
MFYWKIKEWKFCDKLSAEQQRQVMNDWCEKHRHRYRIRQIFVNNAWAVEYRDLLIQ